MDTAREVLREALPIKCIEAVFLGALLTAGWEGTARMPLGFKSGVNGETHRHGLSNWLQIGDVMLVGDSMSLLRQKCTRHV
jgi:hypothetical protein